MAVDAQHEPALASPPVPEPVLSVRDLTVEFETPDGIVRAAEGVSYDLFPGETLAVVGETGSGKSVTALAALGLLMADRGRIVRGSVRFAGRDLLRIRDRELRKLLGVEISMVFQDPVAALNPVQPIGAQIAEVLRVHDPHLSDKAVRARVVELLGLVGVPQPELRVRQYPHQFSGGMCQRVMIAIAIANQPRVLIADEPTTGVDVTIQAQLLELLATAKQETGAATILITHDLGVVAEVADRVCVMYAGRIVEMAGVDDLFAQPRHPYTAALLACVPRVDAETTTLQPIPGYPPNATVTLPGCPFEPRCFLARGRERCLTENPPLRAVAEGRSAACHFTDELVARPSVGGPDAAVAVSPEVVATDERPPAATDGSPAPDPILRVEGLVKHYQIPGGSLLRPRASVVHAVDGVSFSLAPGKTLGLVGESGCGKTTTVRLILRLTDPTAGSVWVAGTDVTRLGHRDLHEIRRDMQVVFQHPYGSLNPRLTAGQNVAEPLRIHGLVDRSTGDRVADLLRRVGLGPEHASRLPAELSGGQQQRVGIARALALSPRLLILDEPVSALDVSVRAQVLGLLATLQEEMGLSYLFVSHDLSVIRLLADDVAVMYLGKIVEIGPRRQVFESPLHPYTRALLSAVPVPDPKVRSIRRRIRVAGELPSPIDPPSGCRFRTRCWLSEKLGNPEICAREEPPLQSATSTPGQPVACHFAGAAA